MTGKTLAEVARPCEQYNKMLASWEMPKALLGGTRQMRKEGTKYLPRWPLEDDKAYAARLQSAVLFNAFKKAINSCAGRVFAKPITLSKDMPEQLVRMFENVDLTGRHIDIFAKDVFLDAESYGLSHIYVDMPRNDAETLAQEKELGVRPYMTHVKAHDLIGWRAEMRNGLFTLTQIRIFEPYTRDAGPYAEEVVDRVRVVWEDRYEVWDAIGKDKEYLLVEQGPMTLGYIPLVTVYTARKNHMIAEPPFEDLAYVNVEHWQSDSDQQTLLHVARVPLLHFAGFGDDFKLAESSAFNGFKGPADSKVSWTELQGRSIEEGRKRGQELMERMQLLSLQPLVTKPGGETATAKAIDTAEANSELQAWALNLQDGLELAAQMMADWAKLGFEAAGSLKVNTDFGISMRDAADLDTLIKARAKRDITRETFLKELMRRGVLMDGMDIEAELEALEESDLPPEGMPLTTPAPPPSELDNEILATLRAGRPGARE